MLGRMLCLALVCFVVGTRAEAPQSPWPTLTPTAQPAKQAFDQGQAIAQLALTMEEEILVEMLPFKPPFKMDKKQMAVIIKLLKKAVKPVLKSERLRNMVAIVDDFMQELEYNQENKKYYSSMLNAAQDVYREVNTMYNAEQDEAQARTMTSIANVYRESVMNQYLVQPFMNWVITPITSRITNAAERVYNMMPSNSLVVDTNWINPFESWGETFNYYVDRISSWSASTRRALESTARLLEQQDAVSSARCIGCSGDDTSVVIDPDSGVQ